MLKPERSGQIGAWADEWHADLVQFLARRTASTADAQDLAQGPQITSFFNVRDNVRLKKGILGDYPLSSDRVGRKSWVLVTRIH